MNIITVTTAAAELGRSREWVQVQCRRLGLGQMVHPRLRLLSRQDLHVLRKTPLKKPGRKPVG